MFENCLSDDAMRVLSGFSFTTDEDQRTVKELTDKFMEYAVGEVNETMEWFNFNQRVQKEGEDFERFVTDVRTLARSCKFCDGCEDSLIRDRIVLGIRDNDSRADLLKTRNLDLGKCIDICRAAQSATSHGKLLKPETVHKVEESGYKVRLEKMPCKFCDALHIMKKEKCPAYGRTCDRCGEKNHFQSKCPKMDKKWQPRERKEQRRGKYGHVYQLEEESSDETEGSDTDYEWCNAITNKATKKMVKCRMMVEGQEVVFQIDTGASVNILPARYAQNI